LYEQHPKVFDVERFTIHSLGRPSIWDVACGHMENNDLNKVARWKSAESL